MKGIGLLVFVLGIWLPGSAQKKTDSLYFAKLYPLESGEFLLIGSEVPGTFRKTVIRHYDKDLKIKKQVYDKNMRNSEIFLDETYPDYWRVISRYRWNKGRVMIYAKDMGLQSATFFKRDHYKDWKRTDDEAAGYPLRADERYFGLDPVFYKDSLCFYFSKESKTIHVSKYDASAIKPVYLPKSSQQIKDPGTVDTYKFKLTENGRILFYYSLNHKGEKRNYFYFLDKTAGDSDFSGFPLGMPDKYITYHVSDISYHPERNLICLGGSICAKPADLPAGENSNVKQTMTGYFLQAYSLNEAEKEMTLLVDQKENMTDEDRGKVIGYKVNRMGIEDNRLFVVFEKFVIEERKVDIKSDMDLAGTYFTYYSTMMKVVNYELDNNVTHFYDVPLNFDLEKDKYYNDKHWRTLHRLKGQGISALLFNGIVNYGYNDLTMVHTDLKGKKSVYADRNYNYYLVDWSGEEPVYSVVYKNTEKARCYFFDGYFVKFFATEWGFILRKIDY